MAYLIDDNKFSTITGLAPSATSTTLNDSGISAASGMGEQQFVIDYDVPSKYEKVTGVLSGTSLTNITRTVPAIDHTADAKICLAHTKEMYDQTVLASEENWIKVLSATINSTSSMTFTYVSASSFKLTGDWTTILVPGTKLKLTNITTKYIYVKSASFSSGETTLTTCSGPGFDYSLASGAISNVYFSYSGSPKDFPVWQAFPYAPTGFSSVPTSATSRFSCEGRTIKWVIYEGGDGTSNSTSKSYTIPIALSATGITLVTPIVTVVKDNGTRAFGKHVGATGSATITCYPTATGATWTSSGSCNIAGDGVFGQGPI